MIKTLFVTLAAGLMFASNTAWAKPQNMDGGVTESAGKTKTITTSAGKKLVLTETTQTPVRVVPLQTHGTGQIKSVSYSSKTPFYSSFIMYAGQREASDAMNGCFDAFQSLGLTVNSTLGYCAKNAKKWCFEFSLISGSEPDIKTYISADTYYKEKDAWTAMDTIQKNYKPRWKILESNVFPKPNKTYYFKFTLATKNEKSIIM